MGELAHNFFLLMTNLTQFKKTDKIVRFFIDGVDAFMPGIRMEYAETADNKQSNTFEIGTKKKSYGFLSLTKGELDSKEMAVLQNAIQMLALIIERNEQDKILEEKSISLEKQVQETSESLELSRTELKTLTENIPDILLRFNLDHRYLYASKNVFEITGIKADDFIGKNNKELGFDSEACKYWENKINETIQTKSIVEDTFSFEHPNGKIIFDWRLIPEFDKQHEVISVLTISRDITEKYFIEKELQESEMEKSFILNSMMEMFTIMDPSLTITWANNAAAKSVQMKKEDIIGKYCYEIWQGRKSICKHCPVQKAIQTRETQDVIIETPDGRVWYLRGTPIFDQQGKVKGAIEFGQDITKQKQAEEKLKESEARYKLLFDSSPNSILVLYQRKYIFANPAAAKHLGFDSAQDITGTDSLETIHPDYHHILLERIKHLKKGRKTKPVVIEVLSKKGEKKFIEIVLFPIKFDKKDCVLIFGEDVTERIYTEQELYSHIEELKVTSEALEQSEAKYRILVENQGEGVGVTDTQDIFTFVNKAATEIFGYTEDQMLGKSIKEFATKRGYKKLEYELKKHKRGEKSTYELEIKRGDGEKRWILVTVSSNMDKNEQFVSSFGIFRDITLRKQAEKALIKSEQIMHSFIAQSYEGIMMLNSEGRVMQWNKAMKEITGYDANEIMNKFVWDINYLLLANETKSKTSYEEIKSKSLDVIRSKKYVAFNRIQEKTIQRKDRTKIVIQQIAFPIELPDETIIGSLMLDITDRKKNLDRLNAEKKKAERYFKGAGSILLVISKDQIIEDINERGCELLGESYEEIAGKNWFDHYLPVETREIIRTKFKEFACQTPEKLHDLFKEGNENNIRNSKGEERTVKWFNTALFDENMQLTGVLSSGIDVTETVRAESELKATSLILESTLNAIPDIIGIQGKNHEVIRYNRAGYELLNLKPEDVKNKKCYELIGRKTTCGTCAANIAYESKKPEKVIRFEEAMNKWLDIRAYPILDESNEIVMVIEHLRDITKNIESEQELKKIRIAVDQSPASIVITSAKGDIEYINPKFTETTGYSYEEAIGANPCILKSGKHEDEFYEDLWKEISSGNVWKGEFINKNKSGELYWENALIAPIKDENDEITHYVAVKENISDKKKLEQMHYSKDIAERSAKLKQQFLANMSHEMRTPMNGIIGMADILMNTKLSAKQKQHLQVIKDSSKSLLYLINDVLDISRIEQGKMNLNPVVFDLREIIRQLKEMFYPSIAKKRISLNVHVDPAFPKKIYADDNRIKQIFSNLVSNAVKYTNEGEIIIKIQLIEQIAENIKVKAEIIDTGIGIREEDQKDLFSIFSRIDDSFTRKTEGTGLGLAIAKKLSEMMNGKVGVISEVGQGSNFWFTFEAKIPDKDALSQKKVQSLGNQKKKFKLKVLYAEDKLVNQKVVSLMLEKAGCKVKIANNGLEVLKIFKEEAFDIIFMDIMMPEMDGITAMQNLQAKYKKVPPIVGLSANAMEGDAEKYMEMGMDDYLTKPVNRNDLLTVLSKWSK